MSRTKNRYLVYSSEINKNYMKKSYKVGIYVRVSVNNGDNSIYNQINLCKAYISRNKELEYVETYIDNGVTGKHFNRKGYIRLIEDINKNKINCIIVKDISRLGRNFIEISKLLELEMVIKGVRVISINDKYDSETEVDKVLDNIILNNMINEIYIRDTSYKIKKSKEYLKKKGAYIGVYAPYGYKIVDSSGIRRLIKSKETYDIVEQMINLYNKNKSYTFIQNWLYENKINTKSDYRKYNRVYELNSENLKRWSIKSIKETIESERRYLLQNLIKR